MGKHTRPGKRERNQRKLGAMWRASQVNDNMHIALREVKQESDIASPFAVATLQSKGARGGHSPYGRAERFETKKPANPQRWSKR